MRGSRYVVAAALLATYVALGVAVAPHPPNGLDLLAGTIFGSETPLAAWLTAVGRWPAYTTLSVLTLTVGLVRRAWLGRCLASVSLLLVAECTNDVMKLVFHRPRPTHWLVTHETTFAYSSGHATNSLVFYGFWAYVALRSSLALPLRVALAAGLLTISGAIGWSRLALGAHYPTDVIGGYLLGAFVLELGLAVAPNLNLPQRQKSAAAGRAKSL